MIAAKVLVGGLLLGALVCGCSEKQKEAARLEAAMKNGDSVVVQEESASADSVVRGQFDSAVAEISAQAVQMMPSDTGDSQTGAVMADSNAVTSHMPASDSGTAGLTNDSNKSVSTEQVMDAGAIPQEDIPKVKSTTPVVTADFQPQENTAGGFVVQVASTPDATEAANLVAKFNKSGYQAFSMTVQVDGATYHRVRIGRYESLAQAEAALVELHEKFKVSGFVASVK